MLCSLYHNENKRHKSGRMRHWVVEETATHRAEGGSPWAMQREGQQHTGNPACTEGLFPHLHGVGQGTTTALLTRNVHMVCRVTHATGMAVQGYSVGHL